MGTRTITGAGAGVGERSVSMSGVGVMADVQAASGLWDSTSLPGSSAGAAAGTAVVANTGWSPGGGNRTASGSRSVLEPVREVTLSLELWGGWLQRSPALLCCCWELAGALVLPWSTQVSGAHPPAGSGAGTGFRGSSAQELPGGLVVFPEPRWSRPSAILLPWDLGGV